MRVEPRPHQVDRDGVGVGDAIDRARGRLGEEVRQCVGRRREPGCHGMASCRARRASQPVSQNRRSLAAQTRPWQCLYFLPEPQGQGSLRPLAPQVAGSAGVDAGGERRAAAAPAIAGTRAGAAAGRAGGRAGGRRPRRRGPGARRASPAAPPGVMIWTWASMRVTSVRSRFSSALEELEGLGLVLVQRVALGVAAEADDAAQVVEGDEVLAPVLVDGLQQHLLLDRAHGLGAVARGLAGHLLVGGGGQALADVGRRRRPPRRPRPAIGSSMPKTCRTSRARPSMSHWSA